MIDETLKSYWCYVTLYRQTKEDFWLQSLRTLAYDPKTRGGAAAIRFLYQEVA